MTLEARFRRRLLVLAAGMLLFSAALGARLVYLQVIDSDSYRRRARDQHEGNIEIAGPRGTIWDRSGHELAVSIETRSVYVQPRLIPNLAEKERIIDGVAAALAAAPGDIRALIESPKNRDFVFLRRRLGPRETHAIEALRIPSIGWMSDSRRFYPRGETASHLLGFVDIDGKGQAGIERYFDEEVRGESSLFISLVDARRRPLAMRAVATGAPGHDLVLTIDDYIQYLADEGIERAMEETAAKAGTVIVMDPRTGEILALANRPGFDPNRPGAASATDRENLAVSFGYEPGSTFKIVTAATALEEHRARAEEWFDCGMGSITLYGRRVGDHHAYSSLTLSDIIAKSSNVGIIRVGQRIPERVFCDYVRRFGFGQRTGITLPSETAGLVQTPGGRNWSGLSQAMMSMGQSIFVSPLQMLAAIAAIGTGGERHAPYVLRAIVGPGGGTGAPPLPAPVRVVSAETARTLVRMMEGVVERGTGKAAAIPGYRVAGKTGTAQKVVGGVYSHTAHIASFVGFVPADDPVLAAIVVLDEPVGKYYGGDIAAPTFARVVGPALAYLRVPPVEPLTALGLPPEPLEARAEAAGSERKKSSPRRTSEDEGEETESRPFPAPWPHAARAATGTIPDLYGWDVRSALTALAQDGCAARIAGSGFVVAQEPPPGTPVSPDVRCSLVLDTKPARQAGGDGQGM